MKELQKDGRERILEFSKAFDKRHKNPSENYGIGGVELRFVLKGSEGAVQFLMSSGWQLEHVRKEFVQKNSSVDYPFAFDLGYHSPKPKYDGQIIMEGSCDYVESGKCYYDGSGLNAVPVMEEFIKNGEESIWERLNEFYEYQFIEQLEKQELKP